MLSLISTVLLAALPFASAQSAAIGAVARAGPGQGPLGLTANAAGCVSAQLGAYPLVAGAVVPALGFVNIGAATCVCVQANTGSTTGFSVTQGTTAGISGLNLPTILTTVSTIGTSVTTPYTVAQLGTILNNEAIAALNAGVNPRGCVYPTGATPNDCTATCGFTCQTGFTRCSSTSSSTGYTCVAGNTCPSGSVVTKREYFGNINHMDVHCSAGKTACATTGNAKNFNGLEFECLDTERDLESCGGCTFPLPGRVTGQDCTAIPNALAVDCKAGACVVNSCTRNFAVSANGTSCEPTGSVKRSSRRSGSSRDRYRRSLREAFASA